MVLYRVLDRLKIDLDERLGEARLLELGEIEELARAAGAAYPLKRSRKSRRGLSPLHGALAMSGRLPRWRHHGHSLDTGWLGG